MAQQNWRAVILTQSNRLEVVEFVSPNNNRQDASAQCLMMFGAKEIKSINPAAVGGSSSSHYDDEQPRQLIEPSWTAIAVLAAIALFISFWPYFLLAGAAYGIYKLVKSMRDS